MSRYLVLGLLLFISTLCVTPVRGNDLYIIRNLKASIATIKIKTEEVMKDNEKLEKDMQTIKQEMDVLDFHYTSTKNSLDEDKKEQLKKLYLLNATIDRQEVDISFYNNEHKRMADLGDRYKFISHLLTEKKEFLQKRLDDGDQQKCFDFEHIATPLEGFTNLFLLDQSTNIEIRDLLSELESAKLDLQKAQMENSNRGVAVNQLRELLKNKKDSYNKIIDQFLDSKKETKKAFDELNQIKKSNDETLKKLENYRHEWKDKISTDLDKARKLKKEIETDYEKALSCYTRIEWEV